MFVWKAISSMTLMIPGDVVAGFLQLRHGGHHLLHLPVAPLRGVHGLRESMAACFVFSLF
jgi:hypothetical protein